MVREQPMRIEHFDLLAIISHHTANRPWLSRRGHRAGQIGDIERIRDRIADLGHAIGQAQHGHFIATVKAALRRDRNDLAINRKAQLASRETNMIGARRLNPVHRREGNRTPHAIQIDEQKRGDGRFGDVVCLRRRLCLTGELQAGLRGDPGTVQQQHRYAAVGQGLPGVKSRRHHGGRRRLDHQFLVVEHRIDGKCVTAARNTHDHERRRVLPVAAVGPGEAEHRAQVDQRQSAIANGRDRRRAEPVDADGTVRAHPDDLFDRLARHRETLIASADHDRRDDRQRQRHVDRRRQAMPGPAGKLDASADLFDIGANHVHADAAPGNIRHFVLGAEPRFEHQIQLRLVRKRAQLGFGATGGHELGDNLVDIDPPSVIGDLDDDLVARLARGNVQRAVLALACGTAIDRRFDAVIDRVADDMAQRVAHHLDHFAIELDVGALDRQRDRFAQARGRIAHHAGQRRE